MMMMMTIILTMMMMMTATATAATTADDDGHLSIMQFFHYVTNKGIYVMFSNLVLCSCS